VNSIYAKIMTGIQTTHHVKTYRSWNVFYRWWKQQICSKNSVWHLTTTD